MKGHKKLSGPPKSFLTKMKKSFKARKTKMGSQMKVRSKTKAQKTAKRTAMKTSVTRRLRMGIKTTMRTRKKRKNAKKMTTPKTSIQSVYFKLKMLIQRRMGKRKSLSWSRWHSAQITGLQSAMMAFCILGVTTRPNSWESRLKNTGLTS